GGARPSPPLWPCPARTPHCPAWPDVTECAVVDPPIGCTHPSGQQPRRPLRVTHWAAPHPPTAKPPPSSAEEDRRDEQRGAGRNVHSPRAGDATQDGDGVGHP